MHDTNLPIEPTEQQVIVPMNRWKIIDNVLHKTYQFRTLVQRNKFIKFVLEYESETQHCAQISMTHDTVSIMLSTKNIQKVTSIDKDYASYCDLTYKDVSYNNE